MEQLNRNHILIPSKPLRGIRTRAVGWNNGPRPGHCCNLVVPSCQSSFLGLRDGVPKAERSLSSHFSEVSCQTRDGERCSLSSDTRQVVSIGVSWASNSWFCLWCDVVWAATASGKHRFNSPCSPCRTPLESFTCSIQTSLDQE